jgi:hypothetical protein
MPQCRPFTHPEAHESQFRRAAATHLSQRSRNALADSMKRINVRRMNGDDDPKAVDPARDTAKGEAGGDGERGNSTHHVGYSTGNGGAGADVAGPEAGGGLTAAAFRMVLRLAVVLLLAYSIHLTMNWLMAWTDSLDHGARLRGGILLMMLVAYAALIAIPFVPGVEIGISLMILEGAAIAPFVYIATLCGLMLAYLAGAALPGATLARLLRDLRLRRAAALVDSITPLGHTARLDLLRRRLPQRLAPSAVRYRHALLALLINLPGNALIGGGGGIAMVAGLSRLYAPLPTVATFALAVAPVPIIIWAFDPSLASWLG